MGKNLDNNNLVGAVFKYLSKTFDRIAQELLIAKLTAYWFDKKSF